WRSGRRWRGAPAANPQPSPRAPHGQWHHHLLQPALHLPRDVVRRLPVGSRLLPCLPRPGRVACALHAPAPQVRQVHVCERPADGHRGTHHRRHPHKYGKCSAVSAGELCGDQRLPSGACGVAVFPGTEINVLTSFSLAAPCRACIGHTKRAHRVQSQGGSHMSEHLKENLSEVWC
ncbi:hypothetical protein Nmel_012256, partial [Mimus melanotis]